MIEKRALRVEDYIEHILGAIQRIETYVSGFDPAAFLENTLVQDAVIRNFQIIGEAANKIQSADPAFEQRHPQLRLDLERDHIDLNRRDSHYGPNLIQAAGRMEAGRYDKALFLGSS